MRNWICLALVLASVGCSRMEESEKERIRKANVSVEKIYRLEHEKMFTWETPAQIVREKYPWEEGISASYLKISKEHFRCKGSESNPLREGIKKQGAIRDCSGICKHGLPYRDGNEFIYPVLIDLVNYLQEKMGAKVVITSGHRCPQHNTYIDISKKRQTSMHQIGAEVDFYVEGFEGSPLEVIRNIMQYYQGHEEPIYRTFQNTKKNSRGIKQPGWYNKEIILRVFENDEGRDFDNRHPYEYVNIELRYDRLKEEYVQYNWNKAFYGYIRK